MRLLYSAGDVKDDCCVEAKSLVVLSLCINLGMLAYFKYTNFLADLFASLFGGTFHHYDIFLPVGISFSLSSH